VVGGTDAGGVGSLAESRLFGGTLSGTLFRGRTLSGKPYSGPFQGRFSRNILAGGWGGRVLCSLAVFQEAVEAEIERSAGEFSAPGPRLARSVI
jgi:hypothetical protein